MGPQTFSRSIPLKELQMWDLQTAGMTCKFTGQRQGSHIIRSCFGGAANNFIVSGSEGIKLSFKLFPFDYRWSVTITLDAKVYIWHRDTGVLLEVLDGHGPGSVNSVVWHPHEASMFASCSDDRTVRIWEPQSSIFCVDSEHVNSASAPGSEPLHHDKGKSRPHISTAFDSFTPTPQ
jgi:WD40 repeat protein